MEGGDAKNKSGGSTSKSIDAGPSSPEKFTVEMADMSDELLQQAILYATQAFEKFDNNAERAGYIKMMLDLFHGNDWHCIIGNFSMSVSHEAEKFVYLSGEDRIICVTVCVYKTGKADSNKKM